MRFFCKLLQTPVLSNVRFFSLKSAKVFKRVCNRDLGHNIKIFNSL